MENKHYRTSVTRRANLIFVQFVVAGVILESWQLLLLLLEMMMMSSVEWATLHPRPGHLQIVEQMIVVGVPYDWPARSVASLKLCQGRTTIAFQNIVISLVVVMVVVVVVVVVPVVCAVIPTLRLSNKIAAFYQVNDIASLQVSPTPSHGDMYVAIQREMEATCTVVRIT
jgi:hypothetical protein